MYGADRSREPVFEITLASWWLIGTLAAVFLAGCVLDVGMILALPMIAIVSLIAWLALLSRAVRTFALGGVGPTSAALTAAIPLLAAVLLVLLFWPVAWASGYVQAQVILAWNIGDYRRDVGQRPPSASPLLWTYGGWLSIDKAIVYVRSDHPEQSVSNEVGGRADCRWLRSDFYDCTIDY